MDKKVKKDDKVGYIQYAIAWINSVLRKAQQNNLTESALVLSAPEEHVLALKLLQLHSVIFRAHREKEPSIIADYIYDLA